MASQDTQQDTEQTDSTAKIQSLGNQRLLKSTVYTAVLLSHNPRILFKQTLLLPIFF